MKNKRLFMGIAASVVLLIVLGYFGIQMYGYYHPQISIFYNPVRSKEFDVQTVNMELAEKSIFGYSEKYHAAGKEWYEKVYTYQKYLNEECFAPAHVEAKWISENGKTRIQYKGAVTDSNGESIAVDESIELSFAFPGK